MPKNDSVTNDSNGSSLGNGGLQKWVFSNGSWSLAYTIAAGLNLVGNGSASGVTGLFGLTGVVVGDTVELYATSNTVTGVETTYLYGISDTLTATTKAAGQSFTTLATSPINSVFRGISFAPTASDVPEPASWALFIVGFGAVGGAMRRRTRTNVRFV
ncbi:PEP-CTERM sorting domain-containing protein [Sphingomonas sp. AP4-R1]|nr:PEP-CTERM sorting domain-containing protein [Sphingomonas sp. AP4-R1]